MIRLIKYIYDSEEFSDNLLNVCSHQLHVDHNKNVILSCHFFQQIHVKRNSENGIKYFRIWFRYYTFRIMKFDIVGLELRLDA